MIQPKDNQNDQIKKLEQKCEEYLNGWKRAKADYINYKKESEKKQVEMVQFSNAAMLAQLLPIVENYKKALNDEHIIAEYKKTESFKGLQNIEKQFTDFLKNLGIEQIKTVGEKFDPELHEAVSRKPASSAAADTAGKKEEEKQADIILEEVKAGYKLQGKVVQAAKVVVSE